MTGAPPPESPELVRAEERLTFVYLERCVVHRDSNAITATDEQGTIHIPAAMIGALLLGPGTRVTHAAMSLIGVCAATVVWVGEGAVRCYAAGRPLARSSRLLEAQARAFANQRQRLAVARRMYEYRFPDEDVSALTMQQLRGREGARVRQIYQRESLRTGVEWVKRDYRPGDMSGSDPINQALSSANTCLYGVVTAVIHALGMSPGLGFVHVGHDQSLVYDVADLFKAQTTIPAAFDVVAQGSEDPVNDVRRVLRDHLVSGKVMDRCVDVLRDLFLSREEQEDVMRIVYDDSMSIWAGRSETRMASGRNFAAGEA
ncbi:type I-E CRISPR-associated endonuclease Cas1 [Kocuria tytonicola]|uniref:type I-E CRISPR-associated endonuclease Cas1e n=1 Tax=Kocuria tytonicola TaxID=2055946 RepID=UPI000EF94C67|nr:type I-E CRISPR-associated endonuclease Cas1e [Kocuria tytonicola]RLZ02777.1 type I-E CRISPR-associated endonuclease Cas1 [Kocuria tytonicola]